MLYVTTRNHQDAFTAHTVLTQSKAEEGSLFVPLHFPKLSPQEQTRFSSLSFGQCVAEILNMFFSVKLSGWDIDFSVGRYPIRLEPLAHRIYIAETWHNPDWNFSRLEQNLRQLLHSDASIPGNWVSIAIRMAVLAGVLGNREILGMGPVDISVITGDFTLPVSAWYLRKMGFPVGNIICCCNENNQFWNLICNGQMPTDEADIPTLVPQADVTLPINLERLVSEYGGTAEAVRFDECCKTGSVYTVSDNLLQQFRTGLYANVVSSSRVETTIPNVYKTHGYIMDPALALAYSGLLDYRAKTGIARTSVAISDASPICTADTVAKAMEIPVAELNKII